MRGTMPPFGSHVQTQRGRSLFFTRLHSGFLICHRESDQVCARVRAGAELCVCVCAFPHSVTMLSSTELSDTETHLCCSLSSEEARGGASFRLTSSPPLSELLSGLSPAGGPAASPPRHLAATPPLQARQIATNHWQRGDRPAALAADSH